jgi:predicted DNA-binding transcriptional regulator AlpA
VSETLRLRTADPPATTAEPVPLLLDQERAWQFLGVSRSRWYRLRSMGELPRPVRVPGGGVFWRRADLERYVARMRPER